jgi:NTP pyrophosphatase (non-canonical NTP hydrolase)
MHYTFKGDGYMKFNEYQEKARTTANYPMVGGVNFSVYPALGLTGEAGEVAEKFKKIIRDKEGLMSESDVVEITKELGDVLWYVSNLASDLGVDLSEVANANINKLFSRKERGVISGNGDNR